MRVNNLPLHYYKRGMPNICQANPRRAFLRDNGDTFCGPASVANSLVWLAKYHFRSLVPSIGNQSEQTAKLKLVETLAEIMDTDSRGTLLDDLVYGIRKYVRDRGYRATINRRGIDSFGGYRSLEPLNLSWLRRNLLDTSNLILEIKNRRIFAYSNNSHLVTGAGFDVTCNEFYVHDPSPDVRYTPTVFEIEDMRYSRYARQLGPFRRRYGTEHNFFQINEFDSDSWNWNDNIALLKGAIAFKVERK